MRTLRYTVTLTFARDQDLSRNETIFKDYLQIAAGNEARKFFGTNLPAVKVEVAPQGGQDAGPIV